MNLYLTFSIVTEHGILEQDINTVGSSEQGWSWNQQWFSGGGR